MAVIWRKKIAQDIYEVRNAGNSVRLYSNGVFHSHYNPNHALSHSIWDLLMLPALFQEKGQIKRVLMMGVGGGTAVKLINRYIAPEKIIGVEINSVHVNVAKKYFKITKNEAELVCADAINWLKNYSGPQFDMIIDDMFGHANGDINRSVELNTRWFNILNKNLAANGVLVINTTEKSTLENCAYFSHQKTANLFQSVYRLEHPKCENYIGVFFKELRLKKHLLQNIHQMENKKFKNALLAMDYKMSKIG